MIKARPGINCYCLVEPEVQEKAIHWLHVAQTEVGTYIVKVCTGVLIVKVPVFGIRANIPAKFPIEDPISLKIEIATQMELTHISYRMNL